MLAALRPEGVRSMTSTTGTSIGAALLFAEGRGATGGDTVSLPNADALQGYAAEWRRSLDQSAGGPG